MSLFSSNARYWAESYGQGEAGPVYPSNIEVGALTLRDKLARDSAAMHEVLDRDDERRNAETPPTDAQYLRMHQRHVARKTVQDLMPFLAADTRAMLIKMVEVHYAT